MKIIFIVVEIEAHEDCSYYNEEGNGPPDDDGIDHSFYLPLYEIDKIDLNNCSGRPTERRNPTRRREYGGGAAAGIPRNRGRAGGCRTRHEILQQQEQVANAGYLSDGSETLSVNSAQSMQNR